MKKLTVSFILVVFGLNYAIAQTSECPPTLSLGVAQTRGLCEGKVGWTNWIYAPFYSRAYTKTDRVWNFAKQSAFVVGALDAHSTSFAISRGWYESNRYVNAVVPEDAPAFGRRLLFEEGFHLVANLALEYAYRHCSGTSKASKVCKWTAIGARGVFTGINIRSTVRGYSVN